MVLDSSNGEKVDLNKRQISLTGEGKGEKKVLTNETGDFCFEVKEGSFTVSPVISSEDKEKGIRFYPVERKVKIVDEPILNVTFS